MREYIVNDTAVALERSFRNSIYRVRSRFPYAVQSVKGSSCISTIRSFSFCVFQASTANDKTTAPRRLVETGPSVCRWRTATSARVHPALPDRIARTTSTNATGTRADMAPARTFTDRTSKSNDIVNGPLPILYVSSFNVNCPFPRNHDATRFSANLFHDFVGPPSSFLLPPSSLLSSASLSLVPSAGPGRCASWQLRTPHQFLSPFRRILLSHRSSSYSFEWSSETRDTRSRNRFCFLKLHGLYV